MKNNFQKMSVLDALYRFRNEIKDLNISSSQRIKLMEDFKQAFQRSLDYDLAFDRISGEIAPEFAHSMTFKSFWSEMNSNDFNKFFGIKNNLDKLRGWIDSEFRSGKREVDILNELLLEGQEQFARPLEQNEIDKFRYIVIDEKVKLRRQGIKIAD